MSEPVSNSHAPGVCPEQFTKENPTPYGYIPMNQADMKEKQKSGQYLAMNQADMKEKQNQYLANKPDKASKNTTEYQKTQYLPGVTVRLLLSAWIAVLCCVFPCGNAAFLAPHASASVVLAQKFQNLRERMKQKRVVGGENADEKANIAEICQLLRECVAQGLFQRNTDSKTIAYAVLDYHEQAESDSAAADVVDGDQRAPDSMWTQWTACYAGLRRAGLLCRELYRPSLRTYIKTLLEQMPRELDARGTWGKNEKDSQALLDKLEADNPTEKSEYLKIRSKKFREMKPRPTLKNAFPILFDYLETGVKRHRFCREDPPYARVKLNWWDGKLDSRLDEMAKFFALPGQLIRVAWLPAAAYAAIGDDCKQEPSQTPGTVLKSLVQSLVANISACVGLPTLGQSPNSDPAKLELLVECMFPLRGPVSGDQFLGYLLTTYVRNGCIPYMDTFGKVGASTVPIGGVSIAHAKVKNSISMICRGAMDREWWQGGSKELVVTVYHTTSPTDVSQTPNNFRTGIRIPPPTLNTALVQCAEAMPNIWSSKNIALQLAQLVELWRGEEVSVTIKESTVGPLVFEGGCETSVENCELINTICTEFELGRPKRN